MTTRGVAVGRVVGTAALAVILALVAAEPAAAADEIQLSDDGVTYGSNLAAPLIPGLPVLVPGDTLSESFWVRNSGPSQAYLTVTLENATWTSSQLADALTVGASAPGNAGHTVALSNSTTCTVLLQNHVLNAGDDVRVTMALTLGDLTGLDGQSATAGLDAGIRLTETAGLPAGPPCATPPATVVVVPRAPSAARPVAALPADTTTDEGAGGAVEGNDEQEEEPATPGEFLALVLTNTLSAFDSTAVAFAAAAVPAGAVLFMIVGRIRRRRGDLTEGTQ